MTKDDQIRIELLEVDPQDSPAHRGKVLYLPDDDELVTEYIEDQRRNSNEPLHITVQAEASRGPRFRKLKAYATAGVTALIAVGILGNMAYDRLKSAVEEFDPTVEETFDMNSFRQEVSTVSSIASGTVESSADVYTSRDYLLADAECNTSVSATQSFRMIPLGDGSNMTFDDERNQITIAIDENPIELDDQKIEMGDPEDCDANSMGRHFGDQDKVFAEAARNAPGELRKRTEVSDSLELTGLHEGQVGLDIAESAASTYQAIAGTVLDVTNSKVTLRFTYNGERILPNRESSTEVLIDAGSIDAND